MAAIKGIARVWHLRVPSCPYVVDVLQLAGAVCTGSRAFGHFQLTSGVTVITMSRFSRIRESAFVLLLSVGVLFLTLFAGDAFPLTSAQVAENATQDDPESRQAIELYQQGKFVDAMPLFEKLVADHPSDPRVREGWA